MMDREKKAKGMQRPRKTFSTLGVHVCLDLCYVLSNEEDSANGAIVTTVTPHFD
jgi:hypothetical protein